MRARSISTNLLVLTILEFGFSSMCFVVSPHCAAEMEPRISLSGGWRGGVPGTGVRFRGRWSMQIGRGEESQARRPPDEANRGERRGADPPTAGPGGESGGTETGPQGRHEQRPEMGRPDGRRACSGGGHGARLLMK
jgi:hypothetical protein